jgi:phosphoribosylanthranilate isomerase
MTWIKICGITSLEDARLAADAGADALGFVFYARSPRRVNVRTVSEIILGLASDLETVGVFVDEKLNTMIDVAKTSGLKAIQWHQTDLGKPHAPGANQQGSLTGYCLGTLKMYYALPAQGLTWEVSEFPLPLPTIFLDSGTAKHPGGTGQTFDWSEAAPLVAKMSKDVRVVVAGGLNAENVATAIRRLHPWGVDVCSGVEAKHGKKDPAKLRAFIQAVREADKVA